MFERFLKKPKRVEFSVDGKPPKKSKPSMWSQDSNQTQLVFNLRQKAYETMQKYGLENFHGPVKLTLTVYDPNPIERADRHDYLGDLDSLIQGVFDSLQPSPPEINNFNIHQAFKETPEIRHDVPLIIADDAQITCTVSQKRKNENPYYTVLIESDEEFKT